MRLPRVGTCEVVESWESTEYSRYMDFYTSVIVEIEQITKVKRCDWPVGRGMDVSTIIENSFRDDWNKDSTVGEVLSKCGF